MSIADKLITVADNVPKVYESGKQAGQAEFWDTYLGDQYNLNYAFVGGKWTKDSFTPTKDLCPQNGNYMFYRFHNAGDGTTIDLESHLESLGIKLDTSKLGSCQYMFRESYIKRLGVINVSSLWGSQSVNYTFYNASWLTKIDKLIVSEKTKYSSPFQGASRLADLTVEGVIGQSGFSVSSCTDLTKASITSIINALSDTTSNIAVTLSKTAVNKAFEISQGAKDGSTSEEWANLIATKSNWTISLS